MSKDDYHVLAYQLLSYLYDCLKAGERPETRHVVWGKGDERTRINERYWTFSCIYGMQGISKGCHSNGRLGAFI